MRTFSANLSIMFLELPFLERFGAARQAGFEFVECWFPYDHPVPTIERVLKDNGLKLVGINTAPGEAGEWGLAALPGRQRDFADSLVQALEYAGRLGSAVHVMAGLAGAIPVAQAQSAYLQNLEHAIGKAGQAGVQLLIEPLNSIDRPGYFLRTVEQADEIIARAGFGALKLMFDCYHVQRESGDLTRRLARYFPIIGHVQIASVPHRNEPNTGEIDYRFVLGELERLGWSGPIGAEYIPLTSTLDGLSWVDSLS